MNRDAHMESANYELAGAFKEILRLRAELAQARINLETVVCAHNKLVNELTQAKADVAALSKDVMPRSEFADLLEERDALRTWRDHCYAAWKERDALKADVAESRHLLRQVIYARCATGTKFIDELEAWKLDDLHQRLVDCVDATAATAPAPVVPASTENEKGQR